jgi:tRNA threonylcarbamoyladenosine biosynthesis protein TsaE
MEKPGTTEWEFSLQELEEVCGEIYSRFSGYRVWLLEGMLGAGKTTFVQQLLRHLGSEDQVLSPTFSLVNEYRSATETRVYHLDLYRLQTAEQTAEIGLFEMAESGYFCLVEWASAVGYVPSDSFIRLVFTHLGETKRRLRILVHEN